MRFAFVLIVKIKLHCAALGNIFVQNILRFAETTVSIDENDEIYGLFVCYTDTFVAYSVVIAVVV